MMWRYKNCRLYFAWTGQGLVGEDGPTHHGAYDIAYFRCIPNMIISAPMNEQELRNLMYTAQLEETQPAFCNPLPARRRRNAQLANAF